MPQARKSSIHFAPVTNIKFAVSHSERTELSEPGYLLPKEHQLPNILVDGSLSENELAELFIKQKECMTGQAKARGSSPFWEGVVVLKNTDGEEQSKKLQAWKVAYENATGHKVLHMTIHLDEGYLDKNGKPHYNPHAHVIISRTNEKNRIIQLKRKQLGEVQDLTAEILQMDRGSTLKERGGKRGRVHIGHKEFRIMANEARLDLEKGNNQKDFYINLLDYKNQQENLNREKIKEANKVIAEKDAEIARLKAEHKAEVQQLKTEYSIDRAALKASGEATQRDYQQLKREHEAEVAKLQEAHAEKMLELENKIQAAAEEKTKTLDEKDAEIARLKSEYAAEREELKASGTAKQSDYQKLKKEHEATLAELATARQEAARVPVLVDQVRAIEAQAATARRGRDEAMGKVAQQATEIEQLKGQAAKVPALVEQVRAIEAQAATARQGRDEAMDKATQQATEIERLKAAYAAERAQLKASGTATQQDYQQLKQQHEAALAKLAKLATAQTEAGKVPDLERDLAKAQQQAQELAQLKAQYQRDREALKASGEAIQRDYQKLKQQHEAALAKLATTQTEAGKVPDLVAQVNALKPKADRVPDLERDLAKAQQQAQELAQLKAQYQRDREALKASGEATQRDYQQLKQQHEASQQEAINTKLTADERYKNLHGQALVLQEERDELAKKVLTLTQRAAAPQAQPERRPAPAAPAQTLAPRPAPQPVPRPTPALQAPAPAPAQTLAERLHESLKALVEWIKGQGGGLKEIDAERSTVCGPVVQLDDLHAVQRVGRGTYAIHRLDQLDKTPAVDDPKTEISYRDGRGKVTGAVQSREKDRR